MAPPPALYKYEAFSLQSLQNLKRQIIHFGSPSRFNDPYDCALPPDIESPTDQDVDAVRRYYLSDPDLPPLGRSQFESFSHTQLREVLLRAARQALNNAVQEFLRNRGVACFSERNDDLLMWSHYGGQCKGFCLAFATKFEPFEKCHQVRYVASVPRLNITTILVDRDFDPVLSLFCTKSSAWSYEAEWRGIHTTAGTEFGYPAAALTDIFFGPDIDAQSLEIACLILTGQNEHVRFWRGARLTSEFRITFSPFTYTSHLAAKRSGQIP